MSSGIKLGGENCFYETVLMEKQSPPTSGLVQIGISGGKSKHEDA